MDRKKKLKIIQVSLSILGLSIIIFTYLIDKKITYHKKKFLQKILRKVLKNN